MLRRRGDGGFVSRVIILKFETKVTRIVSIFEDRMKFDIIFFYDFSFFFYRSRRFRKIDISIKWFRFHFDFHNRFNRLLNL